MQIFIITGAPGSGKSTIAEAVTARFKKSAHIQVDFFRKMIKAGYASPQHWNEEVDRQYFLARKSAAETARNLANAGFVVIIDDIVRQKWLGEWKEYLHGFDIKFVLLNPTLETVKERNRTRAIWSVDERIIESLHELLTNENTKENGWIVIDNTGQTIQETVDDVLSKV